MNRRVAALLRERADLMSRLAQLDRELADEYAVEEADNDQRPRRRSTVKAAPPPRPQVEISEIDRQRARKEARRLGLTVRE